MLNRPGWAKWHPCWDSVSEVVDAVPSCFYCRVDVPVVEVSLRLVAAHSMAALVVTPVEALSPFVGSGLQLLSACNSEPKNGESASTD